MAWDDRAALNGLEKKLFKLMSNEATEAQWAEWLRAPLEHALAGGDDSLALTLLKAGADGGAGWEGCDGRTLLGAAAEGGNHKLVSTVLEAGCFEELDTVYGDDEMRPIHHAVLGGHTDAARALMLAGADVGSVDGRDRSALHYALEGGHLQLAEIVLLAGADPSAQDACGDTPLHLAAAHDNTAFVGTLLRRGASVSATNSKCQIPLHVAAEHDHIAVAEALLKAGSEPNRFTINSVSPLVSACRSLAMTRLLLKHGAGVEVVDMKGYTALHRAGEFGEEAVVEALLEAGADINAQSGGILYTFVTEIDKLTPLHVASLNCNLGAMSAMLRRGADVCAVRSDGQTPLHVLCQASHYARQTAVRAADLLLRYGADETLTDNDGRTSAQLIKQSRYSGPLRVLLANAPADRAWRRRGMLVMCRAFPDKMSTKGGKGRAGKAKSRRGRGRGNGGAGGGCGVGNVSTRVVELEDDALFRAIVAFL
eukprot:g10947.t1